MQKVAVVGCGLIAAKKHIPAFLNLGRAVKLSAVCDVNEELARKVAQHFRIRCVYSNFSEMLQQEKPDIVDICTPPQTHAMLAIQALEKGAHVLLEKPMALSVSDCDAMIAQAAKANKKIGIVHNQLFNPAFMKAKEYIAQGAIGDFIALHILLSTPTDYMSAHKDHWAHRLPGGVLGETGPHIVYLAHAFLKNINNVDVRAKKIIDEYPWSAYEDFRVTLSADNGMASAIMIYASNQWMADIVVMGSKGILRIDLQAQQVRTYNRAQLDAFRVGRSLLKEVSQVLRGATANGLKYVAGKKDDAHQRGIGAFIRSITDGSSFPVDAKEGREVVRIMEMLVKQLPCAGL